MVSRTDLGQDKTLTLSAEQWVWDLATAPGVIDAFAEIWGTRELVRSFDAVSLMMPSRTDVKDGGRWPHADHSPARRGVYVVQGERAPTFATDDRILRLTRRRDSELERQRPGGWGFDGA